MAPSPAPAHSTSDADAEPPARGEPVGTLFAYELWAAYGENPLKADADYKSKWLRVRGTGAISRDPQGRNIVGLMRPEPAGLTPGQYRALPPQEKKWYDEGYPWNLIGFIRKGSETPFVGLDKPQIIVVIGLCRGRREDPGVWKGYVVELDHCELVKLEK